MPIDNGVGISENTFIKQQHFEKILAAHLSICREIFNKGFEYVDPHYYYFDLNAGPGSYEYRHGFYSEQILGSPLLFLRLAEEKQMTYEAVFMESNRLNHSKLSAAILDSQRPDVEVLYGNHNDLLPRYFQTDRRRRYGLAYTDPTGSAPPFDLLARMSRILAYKTLDFLIYCSAANIKRIFRFTGQTLVKQLEPIQKKHWIIREAHAKHQWTFLLGTNWDYMPRFKKLGFHRADSLEGAAILEILNNVRSDEAPRQDAYVGPTLFDFARRNSNEENNRWKERYYRGLWSILNLHWGETIEIMSDGHVSTSGTDVDEGKFYTDDIVEDCGHMEEQSGAAEVDEIFCLGLRELRERFPEALVQVEPNGAVTVFDNDSKQIVQESFSRDDIIGSIISEWNNSNEVD